ncbi:MAG TPA: ribosome maturation factor RimM [Candidatus Acidoferrum sp.]|nr:ribosome maturation factor RimM [Candidatus Acidoferrum sp.]
MSQEWVTIALLGKTRGNRGEVTAFPLSSKLERFESLKEVFLFGTGERREVESTWFHNGTLIFKFQGVDSISDAELLAGVEVRVPASERVPLEEGEFFQDDLIGCDVIDKRTSESIGPVTAWDDGGGSGLLVVGKGDDALLIPFTRSICVEINPAARRITVDLPEGLKDINRP